MYGAGSPDWQTFAYVEHTGAWVWVHGYDHERSHLAGQTLRGPSGVDVVCFKDMYHDILHS